VHEIAYVPAGLLEEPVVVHAAAPLTPLVASVSPDANPVIVVVKLGTAEPTVIALSSARIVNSFGRIVTVAAEPLTNR
jgi:hypothetical protein